MKYVRLWFVALLVAAFAHGEPKVEILSDSDERWEEDKFDPAAPFRLPTFEEIYIPIPEREWFSFIDQTTGTWRKDFK